MGTQLDKLHPLKSLPPALSTTFNHRLQISKMLMGKKTTCFQRSTDTKESLNDPAPAADSSPWRPASLPFTFFDTHYQFTDRWFRQITPLVIRNTRSLGTNTIPKAPRLVHTLGALGPMPQAASQIFQRASEVTLGVSFNTQSQSPDIPGVSSSVLFLRHTDSLQTQSKAPDIYSRAYTEELLTSLNVQAQTPDDPSKTLVSDFHLLSLCGCMEELSASFNAQDQAPDDLHAQDRQCAPYIFVDYFHHDRPELVRFTAKEDVSYLSLQLVSQDSTQELFLRTIESYNGFSPKFICSRMEKKRRKPRVKVVTLKIFFLEKPFNRNLFHIIFYFSFPIWNNK